MRIDSNRNPLNTPAPFIGDPPPVRAPEHLLPVPHWYGPSPLAQDQGGSNEFPQVAPSIPQDHLEPSGVMAKLDRRLNRQDKELSEKARMLQILDALLEMLGTDGVSLDTFRTDHRDCANVKVEGNVINVRRGT